MKIKKDIIYAPILIPTLCRYKHFIKCIESLKKNKLAINTDVYIALDYPKSEEHWEGYNKICEYLNNDFSEFKSFNIIKRNKNYGSRKNMDELYNYILQKYDRFIRTDDDTEFSVNFLEYINKCLSYYEDDEDVIAVTGYSYPVYWNIDKDSNILKSNFICPSWGTAFWRKKFIKIRTELESGYLISNFDNYLKIRKNNKLIDSKFIDYVNSVLCFKENNLISWVTDISLGIYLTINNKYIIMPKLSKVRNNGFDGSGEYCFNIKKSNIKSKHIYASNYDYSSQTIDNENFFEVRPSLQENINDNKKLMNNFDKISKKQLQKAKIKIFLYKVLGKNIYKKIFVLRKKLFVSIKICNSNNY